MHAAGNSIPATIEQLNQFTYEFRLARARARARVRPTWTGREIRPPCLPPPLRTEPVVGRGRYGSLPFLSFSGLSTICRRSQRPRRNSVYDFYRTVRCDTMRRARARARARLINKDALYSAPRARDR